MQQPNIIFIITDQQRFDTIRELGYDYMDTPNLDRMVKRASVGNQGALPVGARLNEITV